MSNLTVDEAQQFVKDVCMGMEAMAFNKYHHHLSDPQTPSIRDNSSAQKEMFGDTWKLFYGIMSGYYEMLGSRRIEQGNWDDDPVDLGLDDRQWREHYDKYGSGPYGRGLKIGKRLAVKNDDTDFTFSESVAEESDKESNFEFTQ